MRRWWPAAVAGLALLLCVPPAALASLSPSPSPQPRPAPGGTPGGGQDRGLPGPGCPTKVMAFYYGWYGGAPVYRHWSDATDDPRYRYQPPATVAAADYPALGPYDSHAAAVVDQHLDWARGAGIDTLISSWWGPGSYEDASLGVLLQQIAATNSPVRASAYLETWALFHGPQFGAGFFTDPDNFSPQGRQAIRDKAAAWLSYLVGTYGTQPGFQHVSKNGHEVPVIFVYTAALFDPLEWQMIFAQVQKTTGVDAFYDGDVEGADAQAQARVFDGLHVYTPVPLTAEGDLSFAARITDPQATGENPAAVVTDPVTVGSDYQAWAVEARALGRTWSATVIPGFDDRKVRNPSFWVSRTHPRAPGSGTPGDRTAGPRNGSQGAGELTYDEFWQLSLRSSPDWVLVTSFNEWHEGTEIEPSLQYEGEFLARTRRWSDLVRRQCGS